MKDFASDVLTFMLARARRGVREFDFFDLRYELSISTSALQLALIQLGSRGETERVDKRTYRFIGSLQREEEETAEEDEKDGENDKRGSGEQSHFADLREFLERKRREEHRSIFDDLDLRPESKRNVFEDEASEDFPIPFQADGEEDQLYKTALKYAVISGSVSATALQQAFSIGYVRAQRFIERMEREGHVVPDVGATRKRKVLLTKEGFKKLYGGEE